MKKLLHYLFQELLSNTFTYCMCGAQAGKEVSFMLQCILHISINS